MGVVAQQTPNTQILPLVPTVPELMGLWTWAHDLNRTLQQNLDSIARKANDTSTYPMTTDLNAGGFSITNLLNLTLSGTITYTGGANSPWVRKIGDTMTGGLVLPAGTTTIHPLTLPHGAAATSPTNGDLWSTTAAFFARINGTTYTLASLEAAQTFTAVQTFSAGWKLDAASLADITGGGNPRLTFDTNDAYIYDRTGNAHDWYIGGTIKGLVDVNGFNGVMGGTTPAAGNFTTVAGTGALSGFTTGSFSAGLTATTGTFSGAVAANAGVTTTQTSASGPMLNAAGNATSLTQNAEIVLSNHSGVAIIIDHTNGAVGVVAFGGGTVSVIYAGPGTQYVNTSTPSTAQTGVYFSSTYRIRHGFAASHTYGVLWLAARNAV